MVTLLAFTVSFPVIIDSAMVLVDVRLSPKAFAPTKLSPAVEMVTFSEYVPEATYTVEFAAGLAATNAENELKAVVQNNKIQC